MRTAEQRACRSDTLPRVTESNEPRAAEPAEPVEAVEPELPSDVDPALWFDSMPCGRHYFVDGNPHTFRGRMWAYCPAKGIYTRVSKGELEHCSREAEYFMRGYLSGNEPGPPISEDEDLLPEEDPRMIRWRIAVELFRETGYWIEGQRPHCDLCGAELLPSEDDPDQGQPCRQCPSARTGNR